MMRARGPGDAAAAAAASSRTTAAQVATRTRIHFHTHTRLSPRSSDRGGHVERRAAAAMALATTPGPRPVAPKPPARFAARAEVPTCADRAMVVREQRVGWGSRGPSSSSPRLHTLKDSFRSSCCGAHSSGGAVPPFSQTTSRSRRKTPRLRRVCKRPKDEPDKHLSGRAWRTDKSKPELVHEQFASDVRGMWLSNSTRRHTCTCTCTRWFGIHV